MSEHLKIQPENFEKIDDKSFEKLEKHAAQKRENAAELAKDNSGEIDNILKRIEKEAVSGSELSKHHKPEKSTARDSDHYSHHQLTTQTFNQTIRSVQKKLPAPQRAFSKVVHNPKIEIASDAIGSTAARPSGLLFGGLFSLLSSIIVLILCRYYGYEYNFSIGLISFVGGYFLGLFIEAISTFFKRK
jgi:hypothetical protein